MDNDLFLWSDCNNNKHPLTNLQSNNCDFKNPEKFSDVATITQMDLLPIKSVSYGPITYEFQAANATLGPLICYPLNSQWNMFDQVIENEEKTEDIHQEFIEMKAKIDENEEKVDENQEKIDMVQKVATEMKEEFKETIKHIQEEQEIVQRHTNETLEKLVGKLQDINSTLGKSFNF